MIYTEHFNSPGVASTHVNLLKQKKVFTKEKSSITKDALGNHYGRRFIVLGHQMDVLASCENTLYWLRNAKLWRETMEYPTSHLYFLAFEILHGMTRESVA